MSILKQNNTLLEYTVLFIEDDSIMRKNYVNVLKDYFVNVYAASDGLEAYSIYRSKKPDILVIDIDIPKLNGIELLKKIRVDDLSTKAIMLTSYSDRDTILSVSNLKINDYLIKPIQRKNLFDSLDKTIKEIQKFNISSNEILELSDDYYWSFSKKELICKDKLVSLTKTEREVLSIIFNNFNHATSYEEIIYSVWDNYNDANFKSMKSTISHIRKKLPQNTIVNEYGIGYKVSV